MPKCFHFYLEPDFAAWLAWKGYSLDPETLKTEVLIDLSNQYLKEKEEDVNSARRPSSSDREGSSR